MGHQILSDRAWGLQVNYDSGGRPAVYADILCRTDWAGRSMVFADKRHPAYDHLDAKKIMGDRHGTQVGDPKKGGKAMYELAILPDPPLRVVIGSDAYKVLYFCQSVMERIIDLYRRPSLERLKITVRIIRNTRKFPTVAT